MKMNKIIEIELKKEEKEYYLIKLKEAAFN